MIYILQHKDKNCAISFSVGHTNKGKENGAFIRYSNRKEPHDPEWNYFTIGYARAVWRDAIRNEYSPIDLSTFGEMK